MQLAPGDRDRRQQGGSSWRFRHVWWDLSHGLSSIAKKHMKNKIDVKIWVFPKIGVPQNGWFGGSPIFGNTHMWGLWGYFQHLSRKDFSLEKFGKFPLDSTCHRGRLLFHNSYPSYVSSSWAAKEAHVLSRLCAQTCPHDSTTILKHLFRQLLVEQTDNCTVRVYTCSQKNWLK